MYPPWRQKSDLRQQRPAALCCYRCLCPVCSQGGHNSQGHWWRRCQWWQAAPEHKWWALSKAVNHNREWLKIEISLWMNIWHVGKSSRKHEKLWILAKAVGVIMAPCVILLQASCCSNLRAAGINLFGDEIINKQITSTWIKQSETKWHIKGICDK